MSPLDREKYERLCRVLRKSLERNKHNISLRRSDQALLDKYEAILNTNKHNNDKDNDRAATNPILDKTVHG